MRPRLKSPNGTPVFAQQVKIVDPRRDRERKSNENKSSRQQFGSFETRDESEYSDTTSDSDSERIPQWSSHQSELSECFESDGVDDSSSALTFDRDIQKRHRTACKQMRAGKVKNALQSFEGILATMLARYGENHPRVGAALHNVAIANLRVSKLDDAMDAIEEAVRIRKQTLGSNDPEVADSLIELGIILVSLKQYEDSRQIFLEALAMRKDEAKYLVLPVDIQKSNIKIAKALNNIGCVHYEMGNFDQGILMIEASIRMQQNTVGELSIFNFTDPTKKPGFLTMASTMCNKGYIHLEQHEFSRAIRIFNASLDIQKYLLGVDNKLILSTLDNLAFAYLAFCSYDAALSTYEELIFNQENSYSVTSLDCASTLKNIVYVHLIQSKFEDALKALCQLEDIQCDALSPDSKHLRETRRLMGQTNFQVMKHPGIACFSCEGADEPMDITKWRPKKPINGSKLSGHRVSCA